MADRTMKQGDTTPAISGTAYDQQLDGAGNRVRVPVPLGDADSVEVIIRRELTGGADVVIGPGACTVLAPAARRTFDGVRWTWDAGCGDWEYEIEAGDFDDVGTDYKVELIETVDSRSVPPRVRRYPSEREDNPTIDVDANLDDDESP